jgi:protease inhibitor Inh
MIKFLCGRPSKRSAIVAVLMLMAAAVGACTTTPQLTAAPSEQAQPSAPPAPPPPQPPPIDVAGRWRLVAASGACLMTLGATPGAAEGTIAPAGGCPGNFFTSRKWTFEHDMLIIRDHKSETLAELSFSAGRFQGQATGGGSITLTRP